MTFAVGQTAWPLSPTTPASKPLDTRGEVVGVGLEKVAFMLVKDHGKLLFPLFNIEAEAIPMSSGRKRDNFLFNADQRNGNLLFR